MWDLSGRVKYIYRRRPVLIGDPAKRLREDPVRMLRSVRFAAKLNFSIDKTVSEAMHELAVLLTNVPSARLFDEFLKMFQAGFAEKTLALLREYKLFEQLFPQTSAALDRDDSFARFVQSALISTDRRIAHGKSVTPMFLLGVCLWAPVQ